MDDEDVKSDGYGLPQRIGYSCASTVVQLLLALVCLAIGAYIGSLALQFTTLIGISATPPGLVYAHLADDRLADGTLIAPATPSGRRRLLADVADFVEFDDRL